jgi:hypothetical protein
MNMNLVEDGGLARAMEVIETLQRQVNELNERLINQERGVSPVRQVPTALPITVNVPRLHSIMNRPDKYSGDRKLSVVKTFCEKMQDYLDCQPDLNEDQKIKVTASCLTGSAYTWYSQWSNKFGGAKSALNLLASLKTHFAPPLSDQAARARLRSHRQVGKVKDYAEKFREILDEIDEIAEPETIAAFIGGLKPVLQEKVAALQLTTDLTFDQIEQYVKDLDLIASNQGPYRQPFGQYSSNSPHSGTSSPMEGVVFGGLTASEIRECVKEGKCFKCKRKDAHESWCRSKFTLPRARLNALATQEGEVNKPVESYPVVLSAIDQNVESPKMCTPVLIHKARMMGVEVNVLLDTGATSNFVSQNLVNRLGIQCNQLEKSINLTLGDSSRSGVVIDQYAVISLFDKNNVSLSVSALVIKSMMTGVDVILGRTFQKFNHGRICPDTNDILAEDSQWQLPLKLEDEAQFFAIKLNFIDIKDKKDKNVDQEIIRQFQDVFEFGSHKSKLLEKLGNVGSHRIELIDDNVQPISTPAYRMSPFELKELENQVNDMIQKGWIRPSDSPWSSPVLFTKKSNGKLRLCVDYRRINTLTKPDAYQLPRIDDNLDRLGGSQYFSTIDLSSGFHQLPMQKDSIQLTAFGSRVGHYEYTVMPFGLRNAPSSFQRLMNTILKDFIDKFVVVYIDDILIFSPDIDTHKSHIKLVLERLREYGLTANKDKSSFFRKSVDYLGFTISQNSIKPMKSKVECIANWPVPTSASDIRSFLGLCNYYRRFVHNYTALADPLLRMMVQKNFSWNTDCDSSFNNLKRALSSECILSMPNFSQPFHVWPDASKIAVGGILSQSIDGIHQPICFFIEEII